MVFGLGLGLNSKSLGSSSNWNRKRALLCGAGLGIRDPKGLPVFLQDGVQVASGGAGVVTTPIELNKAFRGLEGDLIAVQGVALAICLSIVALGHLPLSKGLGYGLNRHKGFLFSLNFIGFDLYGWA